MTKKDVKNIEKQAAELLDEARRAVEMHRITGSELYFLEAGTWDIVKIINTEPDEFNQDLRTELLALHDWAEDEILNYIH